MADDTKSLRWLRKQLVGTEERATGSINKSENEQLNALDNIKPGDHMDHLEKPHRNPLGYTKE